MKATWKVRICLVVAVLAVMTVGMAGVWAESAIKPVSDQTVHRAMPLGGAFYFETEEQEIWKWTPGDTAFTHYCTLPPLAEWEESWRTTPFDRLPEEAKEALRTEVSYIAAGDGKLWALNYYTGRIGEIQDQGIAWLPQQMDTAHFLRPEESAMDYFYAAITFVQDGKLYMFGDNGNRLGGNRDSRVLVSLDMTSGALRVYDTGDAVTLCEEEPGFVLVVRKGKGATMRLSRLNLDTGHMEDFPAVIPFQDRTDEGLESLGGLCYQQGTGRIFFTFQKKLWQMTEDQQSFQAIRDMPTGSDWAYSGYALPDNTYVIVMEVHLYHLPITAK